MPVSLDTIIEPVGVLIYPLAVCSLVSVWVILDKSVFWIQYLRRRNRPYLTQCLAAVQRNDNTGALAIVKQHAHPVLRVFGTALHCHTRHQSSQLHYACSRELRGMRSRLNALVTIITISPLLGILGTIVGIIKAFQGLSIEAGLDPTVMIQGISSALWTTAIGLSITIVTFIPYYFFQSRVEKAGHDLEDWATQFELARAGELG